MLQFDLTPKSEIIDDYEIDLSQYQLRKSHDPSRVPSSFQHIDSDLIINWGGGNQVYHGRFNPHAGLISADSSWKSDFSYSFVPRENLAVYLKKSKEYSRLETAEDRNQFDHAYGIYYYAKKIIMIEGQEEIWHDEDFIRVVMDLFFLNGCRSRLKDKRPNSPNYFQFRPHNLPEQFWCTRKLKANSIPGLPAEV
ncbi:MAG: hypothetical protein AAF429_03440 [Pseudomonadota bacterium]